MGTTKKQRLSFRMGVLVTVGCGVGLTVLKEAPTLTQVMTVPSSRQAAATISDTKPASAKFLQRLNVISSSEQLDPSWLVGPRNRSALSSRTRTGGRRSNPPPPSAADVNFTEFYSEARIDRAGSAIQHMLTALAYGYATNTTYKGACCRLKVDEKRLAKRLALIRLVGLQDDLVLACPPADHLDFVLTEEFMPHKRQSVITPGFVAWLRTRAKPPPREASGGGRSMLAVVHVRRGDIDPCRHLKPRYLPSSYYVEVIQRHVPPDVPVLVYSESASFEPFTEFEALRSSGYNVTVRLDTDVAEVWTKIMAATYFVMSRSTFAFLPSVLNVNATILYPYNCLQITMPEWKQVDYDIMKRSQFRVEELVEQRCHNYTSFKPLS